MALIDDILTSVNAALAANLDWLDATYGKIERKRKTDTDSKTVNYPGVFIGADNSIDDYLNMLPDSDLGNYCYWEILDDQEYLLINRDVRPKFRFKLVFWWNWPDLYPADWRTRSIEEVKAQILNILVHSSYTRMNTAFIVYESADKIYSGFSHNETTRQFLMRPYGGLAIEGEIWGTFGCNLSLPLPTISPSIAGSLPENYSSSRQRRALETWYGEAMYWQTWPFETGANNEAELDGLVEADTGIIVRREAMGINSVSGISEAWLPQVTPDGSGGYTTFLPDFYTDIFITLFWTRS